MLTNATVEKLREMNLKIMAEKFKEQLANPDIASLSFEDRFSLVVDAEFANRKTRRLTRLIKSAGYAYSNACIEDVEYHADRNLDKSMIARLGTCVYVREHHNIIILGATGSGKTYLSNAFGIAANRDFMSVKYVRLPELLAELDISRAEGNYRKVFKQYRGVNLLVLDEWLLFPLKDSEARDVLEIVEARYQKGSTIFCSQFDVAGWHQKLGDSTIADAICDRIAHDSYTIIIGGKDSMRKRKGLKEKR